MAIHKMMLIFIFLFISTLKNTNAFANGRLEIVKSKIPAERGELTRQLYLKEIKYLDSATGKQELTNLLAFAKQNNDPALSVVCLLLLAEYEEDIFPPRGKGDDAIVLSYLTSAKSIAEKNKLAIELGKSYHAIGLFNYHRKKYEKAFENIYRANNIFKIEGYEKVTGLYRIMMDIGFLYYDYNILDSALPYLLLASKQKSTITWEQKMTNNAIGIIYQKYKKYDSALYYQLITQAIAVKDKDSTWIGIAQCYTGSIFMTMNKYDSATKYLEAGAELCKKRKEWTTYVVANTNLAKIKIEQQKYEEALELLNNARQMSINIVDIRLLQQLYEQYVSYYEKTNKPSIAFQYLKLFNKVNDSLMLVYNEKMYTNAQVRIESERKLGTINLLQSEKKYLLITRNLVVSLLFVIIVVVYLLVIRIRTKNKIKLLQFENEQSILQLEKKVAQESLEGAGKALEFYKDNLLLKNDLIDQYQLEIELLNSQVSGTVQVEKQQALATLLQSTILTDAEWNDFKLLFDKVHQGYIVRLNCQYPSFTFSEIRLILLSRLDLSDREISRMLGISIDAVRKTRHRLRKKLNDNEQLNFEDLIASI